MYTTFFDRFKQAVSEFPEKTALIFDEKQLSYTELDEKSDLLAHALHAKGVVSGDIIPILLERGVDSVIAMLGVLKSGAAVCNISTDYPQERIDFICRDISAKLLIDEKFLQECKSVNPTVNFQPSTVNRHDLAVVVYTSGSTGNPKGVLLSHQAMNMSLDGTLCGFGSEESFLLIASLTFIGGITYALSSLAAGQTLHLASESLRKDANKIIEYIRTNAVTMAFFPPQLARIVIEKSDGLLKVILTGSDKVSGLYSDKTRLFNVYGASETFGPVTSFEIDKPYAGLTPVGKVYGDSRAVLLDGEICISGQIANGYINLPELTAERFVRHEGTTFYKTGDIGEIDEDGNLI